MDHTTKNCNRREFLAKSAAGFAAAGVIGLPAADKRPSTATFRRRIRQKDMIYRTLGRTGITVPIVSMGVMNADNPAVVQKSYEIGVRFFDTAEGYQRGRNESMVGDVVKQLGVRDEVIIQTKIPHPNFRRRGTMLSSSEVKADYLRRLDACLERLKTNYVDILLIHQPSVELMNDTAVMDALKQAQKEKKTRFIGVSVHGGMADILNEAARSEFYDVVLSSYNFTLANDEDIANALKNATGKNIGIVAMKTQAGGERRYKKPVNHTATLKWALRNENIATAVPGYTNFDHMNEDFSVVDNLEFTDDEKEFLENKDVKLGMNYCRQCRECVNDCPKGVDVPALMRAHMYASGYSNFFAARETLNGIDASAGIQNCTSCDVCSVRCRHIVDVAANISDLKMLYA